MPCSKCNLESYPELYGPGRKAGALFAAISMLITIFGGLLLYAFRRRHRLLVNRDIWLSVGSSLVSLIYLYTPYKEYFGEAAMPCAAYYFCGCVGYTFLFAFNTTRVVAMYARHCRQKIVAEHASAGPENDYMVEDNIEAHAANILQSGVQPELAIPVSGSIEIILFRYRLHEVRSQVALLFILSTPNLLNYFVRLGVSPLYSSLLEVGCRFDLKQARANTMSFEIFQSYCSPHTMTNFPPPPPNSLLHTPSFHASFTSPQDIMFTLPVFDIVLVLFPILLRLLRRPDSFFLREEVLAQLLLIPPFLVWFLVG